MKEKFSILVGANEPETVKVICTVDELPVVAMAICRAKENDEGRPVACVAKRGEVSFNDFDFMFSDCM